jgi:hypothetical protein
MSEVARIRGAEVVRLGHDRAAISGSLGQVGAVLDLLRRAGELAAASDPVPDGRPGHVLVTVRLLPVLPATAPPAPFWTPRRAAALAAAGVAALGLLGVAGWLLLTWLAAHLAAVVAVLVAVAVLVGLAGPRACKIVITVKHWH